MKTHDIFNVGVGLLDMENLTSGKRNEDNILYVYIYIKIDIYIYGHVYVAPLSNLGYREHHGNFVHVTCSAQF